MNGETIYSKYAKTYRESMPRHPPTWEHGTYWAQSKAPLLAWPFLSPNERETWNKLAKSVTPTKRKASK